MSVEPQSVGSDPGIAALLAELAGEVKSLSSGIGDIAKWRAADSVAEKALAQGEPAKKPKHSFGHWLHQVYLAQRYHSKDAIDCLRDQYITQTLTEDSGSAGGYLVPAEFRRELLSANEKMAIVRSRAFVQPMASRTLSIPALDVTTALAAGNNPFFGGVIANWIETDTTKPATEPKFRQLELVAHELAGYTPVGKALLEDSAIALETLLPRLFAQAIAWHEDYAFLRGDGVGKPLGIMNATALKSVTRSGAGAFVLADAAKMYANWMPISDNPAGHVWIMNRTVVEKLVVMLDSSNVVFIPNARETVPMTLFGIPIVLTHITPTVGTVGDVLLCDLSAYVVGDRNVTDIDSSKDFLFTSNQVTWRFSQRVDGKPWLNNVITLSDATTTVSPFVALAT